MKPAKKTKPAPAAGLRAVILAGGKGVRLHPFTVNFPKPLVPLGDKPVLEVLMERLLAFGINDVTLTLGHLAELLKAYVEEDEPTGTAGSLAHVRGLDRTFLVMNGDLLTDLDFGALVNFHRQQKAMLTIATHMRSVKVDLGVLDFDKEYRITAYREKPEHHYHVSMGVYVYEPAVLRHIPKGKYLDFPDLVLKLVANGDRVCAYPAKCQWLDSGRPDDYARAQAIFAEKRSASERV